MEFISNRKRETVKKIRGKKKFLGEFSSETKILDWETLKF